jgi:hypothetical protein
MKFISCQTKFRLLLAVAFLTFLPDRVHAQGTRPIFIGSNRPQLAQSMRRSESTAFALSYMTSDQMAEKIRYLTGFYHPGYEEFGSIIGKLDPNTGVRTNDRPTVLSVLIVERLVSEVAASVIEREAFLDNEDRIVFPGIDLEHSPTPEVLARFIGETCPNWVARTCPDTVQESLITDFRQVETSAGVSAAWGGVIANLMENGALYYY